jgi:uncharacterized protein
MPSVRGRPDRDGRALHARDLWTWTVQGFPPKAPPYVGNADPKTFEPFGVGYVELPGEVKVEARLTEADPAKLVIGMEMELVIVPLATDDDGNEIVTFAFAPVPATAGDEHGDDAHGNEEPS